MKIAIGTSGTPQFAAVGSDHEFPWQHGNQLAQIRCREARWRSWRMPISRDLLRAHARNRRTHRRAAACVHESLRCADQRRARSDRRGGRAFQRVARAAYRRRSPRCLVSLPRPGRPVAVPLPAPFHELDNVIMTPHSSAWTEGLFRRRGGEIAANLGRLARGEPLQNVVRSAQAYTCRRPVLRQHRVIRDRAPP